MREFPHHQYLILDKYRQSPTSSTFLVKPVTGDGIARILKLYSGPSARRKLKSLEEDLCWQKGLVHPQLLGIEAAGISGRESFFTTRPFLDSSIDLSGAGAPVILQILIAVSFLHNHARPHGRIRPSNLFLVNGSVRLADLQLPDDFRAATLEDIRFTAPELLEGGAPTIEGDCYSLGALLYRFYAKRDPFDDSTVENLKEKYLHVRIPSIRSVSGIRETVARAIDGLLHRNPRRRVSAFGALVREFPFDPVSASRVPMIGRRESLDKMHSQISSASRKTLDVSLIEGEAGIGKARLVEELRFKSNFQNSPLHAVSCHSPSEPPLAPIVKLIRAVVNQQSQIRKSAVQRCLGTYEESLQPILEGSSEETSDRISVPEERVVQDLIGLIAALARQESLKLCIENIDRAEPATLSFIRQICFRASELNVRLILTCRGSASFSLPAEMGAFLGAHFNRVSLGPLTKIESRELVQYLDANPRRQVQILNYAGGNPSWLLDYGKNESGHALAAKIHARILDAMSGEAIKLVHALALLRTPATVELLVRLVSLDNDSVRETLLWLRSIGAVHELNQAFEMHLDDLRKVIVSGFSARATQSMHQALYGVLQSLAGVEEESFAEHAFQARLFDKAAAHFSALAHSAAKRGDYGSAINHYEKLRKIRRTMKQLLGFEQEVELAMCLAKAGKLRLAEQIYIRVLADTEIEEDLRIQLSLMYRGGEIDRTYLDQRLAFLREAIESSKCGQIHPSILLSKLTVSCVAAGDFPGAADSLTRAQILLEGRPDKDGQQIAKAAEGFLLMNKGMFRVAFDIYRTLPCQSWGVTAAALTNRAVCLEHLGNIRNAVATQKRAYRLASKAGHLVGQFLCLANLGVFNTKLGNLKEANDFFGQMKQRMGESGSTIGISYKGVEAEAAVLELMEGRHDVALQRLRVALNSPTLLRSTRFQCLILQSEIHYLLNAEIGNSEVDRIAEEGAWSDSPLYKVQLSLLRSRSKHNIREAVAILESAIVTARDASLMYELCRLELEVSSRLREANSSEASSHVEEALRIAKRNGYRPLHAKALLVRGLCARHDKEREHFLGQSFMLASGIGIPDIVSESAYHLGVLYQSMKQYAASREYLANSTRVTSEIADQIPLRFQSKYLSVPWRKDARTRYGEYLRDEPVRVPSSEAGISSRGHHYFRALYRISIAAGSAQTVDIFLRELLSAIGLTRDRVIVMLKSGEHTTWHSTGVTVTDQLRQCVSAVAVKAMGHAQFNAHDRWAPFQSGQFSGGIYVICPKGNPMSEDEMEFFAILGTIVCSALEQVHVRAVDRPASEAMANFHGIVGNSRATRNLCAHIEAISNNNATILIQGETGTGKELVARAIHGLSARARSPFVAIDCGAIAEGLMESELFGSKRGAFTGAVADRAGVFEAAQHGTLFLDEVSNMSLGMQARLLRVLQEREIRRVGEVRSRPIDVRLIAASNTNLKQLVAEGRFRQDLLFRLNVISVDIPPLRARREDIPVLAVHFLNQLNATQHTSKVFGAEALHPLLAYGFPGNIRELQNSVERSFFTAPGRTISSVPIERLDADKVTDEVRDWLDDLVEGRRNFWTAIHDRYKRRDIPREKIVALIDLGLRTTRGSYKNLASLLHIDPQEYRRLMDFLRRNNCLLDFRPYRKVASIS